MNILTMKNDTSLILLALKLNIQRNSPPKESGARETRSATEMSGSSVRMLAD